MSLYSVSNVKKINVPEKAEYSPEALQAAEPEQPERNPGLHQLIQAMDKNSLSTLHNRLSCLLKAFELPENNVLHTISDNIGALQDSFVEALYPILLGTNADLSIKITLRLNFAEQLVVCGEHPDKEYLENTLASSPELAAAFKEIAVQSELLRDVGNISKTLGATDLDGFPGICRLPRKNSYQVRVKGDMSHFYFSG